jgi:hypothetical protein
MTWYILGLWMKEKASRYGGLLWLYWLISHRQLTRDGPPDWWLGRGLTTHHKNHPYEIIQVTLNLHGLFCLDKSKQHKVDMRFISWSVRIPYKSVFQKTVPIKLAKYKLYLVRVHFVRWNKGGTEPADEYTVYPIVHYHTTPLPSCWQKPHNSLLSSTRFFQNVKYGSIKTIK